MNTEQTSTTEPSDETDGAVEDAVEHPSTEAAVADVDELEGRLSDVEDAMARLASGELDAAERSIESLTERIGEASQQRPEGAAPTT